MILCSHCGRQNENDSNFCPCCGNRLVGDHYIVARLSVLGKRGGREYLLADIDRYIGREAGNDIVVEDDEMSARHARIWFTEQEFWVEDLHSTNGTFVNGDRIAGPTRLNDEDLVKMGHTLLKFET